MHTDILSIKSDKTVLLALQWFFTGSTELNFTPVPHANQICTKLKTLKDLEFNYNQTGGSSIVKTDESDTQ